MKAIELLREQFNGHISLVEKRPGIQQLYAPLYHEDGDMMSIYFDIAKDAELSANSKITISDHGLTLMRLSYSYDIDTPNKERIFQKILAENGITETDGTLSFDTTPESLYPAILHFSQIIAKVCNMRQFKREILASLFEEMLDNFIEEALSKYNLQKSTTPLPERDDLEVDFQLKPNKVPFYLFGVRDSAKARLATITCLEFLRAKLPFKSMVIHEDFNKLSRKDCSRLTSACDKQFTSLDDFQQNVGSYLERELAH
jgi:hypothetical protein